MLSLKSILFISLFILIPGFLLGMTLFKNFLSSFTQLIFGVTTMITIIIVIFPLLSLYNLAFILQFLIIAFIAFFTIKNFNSLRENFAKLKVGKEYFFSLLLFTLLGMWTGIQASSIPIKNLDQFIVEPDIYHQLSVSAEILNHGPNIIPFVAVSEVPLIYHFGSYGLGAFLSFGGFFELIFSQYKIEFILISFIYVTSLSVVAYELTKSKFSTLLSIIFGALTLYPQFPLTSDFKNSIFRPVTISQLLASALLLTFVGFLFVNKDKFIKLISLESFVLFFLVLAATLSKGSTGAFLLGFAFIWVLLDKIFDKRWTSRNTLFGSFLGFIIALPLVFDFGATGTNGSSLNFEPLKTYEIALSSNLPDFSNLVLFTYTTLIIFSMLLPTVISILFINNKAFTRELISLNILILVSIVFLSLIYVWGDSQWYFYKSIFPLYGILIAVVSKLLLTKISDPKIIFVVLLLGSFAYPIIHSFVNRLTKSYIVGDYLIWFLAMALTFAVLISIIFFIYNFDFNLILKLAAFGLLGVGMLSSLLQLESKPVPNNNYEHPWSLTIGTEEVANFINQNSDKDSILITNRHCVGPIEEAACHSRMFALSALSKRRVFIEGWSYTPCPVEDPLVNSFWNESDYLLSRNAVLQPNSELLPLLSSNNVEWIFIDERRPFSEDLDLIAELKFRSGLASAWKVKSQPTAGSAVNKSGCS